MRRGAGLVLGVAIVLGAVLGSAGGAGAGAYDDPFFLGWSNFIPSVTTDFAANTESDCPKGSLKCVDNVIREMTRRYDRLGCDHDSAFALTYLLTTKEYRNAVNDPSFFSDNAFINHQDAGFADLYFKAFDAWQAGRLADVPPAWRLAFRATDRREVTGMGDVLLGMNAHVNRDLPFILNAIGLVKPDGSSRKPDHDRVNDFLNAVNKYLLTTASGYLDPTMDDGDVPGTTIDNSASVQLLVAWREGAWRNAERLAGATSDAERATIAQDIEDTAARIGLGIREAYRYNGITNGTTAARDSFCTANWRAL
jgi:hypothetical protein